MTLLKKNEGLRFVTGYSYATNLLKAINNMTFFYNPLWEYNDNTKGTLPVAFFHLKGIHETMTSEVQTKKVMFYNSQKNTTVDSASGSVINVIADNIVNKPKTYKLDVIVPYSSATLLFNSAYFNTEQVAMVGDFFQRGSSVVSDNVFSYVTPYMELMKAIFNSLGILDASAVLDFPKSIIEKPTPNKDSLEYLWKSRTIAKLKLWNGWKYKNVVITDIDISKEPTEDGVEEATITCTEVPVMKMRTYNDLRFIPKEVRTKRTGLDIISDIRKKGIKKAGEMLYNGTSNEDTTVALSLLR